MRSTEEKLHMKRSRPSDKNISNKCLTAIALATVASLSVAFFVTVRNLLVTCCLPLRHFKAAVSMAVRVDRISGPSCQTCSLQSETNLTRNACDGMSKAVEPYGLYQLHNELAKF